ncbi:MAG: tetratricopeptide repeat protein, partial [Gemmatimonadota bacterium]
MSRIGGVRAMMGTPIVTLIATAFTAFVPAGLAGQERADCAAALPQIIDAGWREYRSGRISQAEATFTEATACDPGHTGARMGLGYSALRQGHGARARVIFETILAEDDTQVDALVGLGLLAWREGAVG